MAIIGSTAPAPSAIYVPGIGTPGRDGTDGTDGRNGRDGRDGSPGQGVIFTRTAAVGIPAWRALVANDDGSVILADPSNTAHRGRVIGVTARGASAGLQASIQNAGDLLGPSGGFVAGTPLFVGPGGILTPTVPTSGWSQIVATAVSSSQIVVALGEAEVISSDGTALVVPTGFASAASPDDVAAGEDPNKFVTPPALFPVLSQKVGRTDGLKADLPFLTPNVVRVLEAWLADLMYAGADLRARGFIGDGASHPLSERFSTLAAARGIFPRANSLSEEIDGHAIQLAIDQQHAGVKPVVISLPPGCYAQISFPIRSGKLPIFVKGERSTITQRTAGADGWHHGTADTGFKALYGATFRMSGVQMSCLGVGGTAFVVEQDPTSGYFIMSDVNIVGSGNSAENYWDRGVVGTGTSYTTFTNVSALGQLGGSLVGKKDAMKFTFDTQQFPTTQGAFIYRFIDCDISWYGRGYNFDIPRTMEGVWFERGNINSCPLGVRLYNSTPDQGGGIASPQYVFDGTLMECWSTFFDIQSLKFVNITGCTFLVNGPKPEFTADSYLWPWAKIGVNTTDVLFYNNHFEFFGGSHPLCLLDVSAAGIENVDFNNNHFRFNPDTGPSYLIKFGEGSFACKNVKEYDNIGLTGMNFSTVVGASQRSSGNYSKSSIASSLLANGDALLGIDYSSGLATIAGYRVATPVASGNARLVTFPIPDGVFSAAPRVVNPYFADDAGVLPGEVPATNVNLTSRTQIVINVVGYSGSGARRFGFTGVG